MTVLTFWKPSLVPSSGKEAPNLVDHLDRAILSRTIEILNLRHAPENRSSPRGCNSEMTTEKLKTKQY